MFTAPPQGDGLSYIDDHSIHVPLGEDDDSSDISSIYSSNLMGLSRAYPRAEKHSSGTGTGSTSEHFEDEVLDIDKKYRENVGYYDESIDEDHDCLPIWLTEAKTSVKILILSSLSLLMGSVIFIFVAIAMSNNSNNMDNRNADVTALGENTQDVSVSTRSGGQQILAFSPTPSPESPSQTIGEDGTIILSLSSAPPSNDPTAVPTISPTDTPSLVPSALPSMIPTLIQPEDCEDSTEKIFFSKYQGVYCHQLDEDDCSDVRFKVHCQKACNTCGMSPFPTEEPTPLFFDSDTNVPSLEPSSTLSTSPSTTHSVVPSSSSLPTLAPSAVPSLSLTLAPSEVRSHPPTLVPSIVPSSPLTSVPSVVPSLSPTSVASVPPSSSPSLAPSEPIPKAAFYVMSGAIDEEERITLEKKLGNLPASHGEWIFHLGGFNDPVLTKCEENVYSDFSTLFSRSSVPVYCVPGDDEWNNCPDPGLAWNNWTKYLDKYDTKYWPDPPGYTVSRLQKHTHNFAFVQNRVLYVGVNVLSGTVHKRAQWNRLHQISLGWIEEKVASTANDTNLIMIVGHAARSDNNNDFFEPLFAAAESWGNPVVYLYESGNTRRTEENADVTQNVQMLGVDGSSWPPLRLVVDANSRKVHVGHFQEEPTPLPSSSPTSTPSAKPSGKPVTSTPTEQPSSVPSNTPTITSSSQPSFRPSEEPSGMPTQSPSSLPSLEPSVETTEIPSKEPSINPSPQPTTSPSQFPSYKPSSQPSTTPTNTQIMSPPTNQPTKENIVETKEGSSIFYVTGGMFQGEQRKDLVKSLQSLPSSNGEWMVHLGDFNNFFETNCDASAYEDFDKLFSNSAVPVYCTPGDNEWNDCPSPDQAWTNWMTYLGNYDTRHWEEPSLYTVRRQHGHKENFAFIRHKVLHIGVNMVGGHIHDQAEWNNRYASNIGWIEDRYTKHLSNTEIVVIFGHAGPDATNDEFFSKLGNFAKTWDKVVMYVHEDSTREMSVSSKFKGVQKFLIMNIKGGIWPPARIHFDTVSNRIHINQHNWHLKD